MERNAIGVALRGGTVENTGTVGAMLWNADKDSVELSHVTRNGGNSNSCARDATNDGHVESSAASSMVNDARIQRPTSFSHEEQLLEDCQL